MFFHLKVNNESNKRNRKIFFPNSVPFLSGLPLFVFRNFQTRNKTHPKNHGEK